VFDWHLCLTPLLLLPIALLFRFVGCTAVLGDFTVAPAPQPSLLRLNLDMDLQKATAADNRQVKEVKVFWSLWKLGSPWKTVPAPAIHIVPTEALDDFLDPARDPGGEYSVSVADLAVSDQVSCSCQVTQGVATGDPPDETVKVNSAVVGLQPSTPYIFTLVLKPPVSATSKRTFAIEEYTPS
jgi:hypothetical protein